MNKCIWIVFLFISFSLFANEDLPVLVFPILDSKHIGNNCSEESNVVVVKLELSNKGVIQKISFVKKSSVEEINSEAKANIIASSPFTEIEGMSPKEAEKYSKVLMSYTIPCKHI
jgi:hypothetical protein